MTTKTDITLLPCPCCGVAARMSDDYENSDGEPAVECSSCNLLSWTVEDWNRRAAVEADRQGRMPSDEEIEEFCAAYADEMGCIHDDTHVDLIRAALSRYSSGQPAAPTGLDFHIDSRNGFHTVVFDDGSRRSASEQECALWDALMSGQPAAATADYERGRADGWAAGLDEAHGRPAASAEPFQTRVQPWLIECFGPTIAGDREERNQRFMEEALELVQSCGCTASEAHKLVGYVFGRPVGEPAQEVGGVMVTLAALCLANDLDMHVAGEKELARINAPETLLKIRAKQAAKPKYSPLPAAPVAAQAPVVAWMDDGSTTRGVGKPAYRVVSAATKAEMPATVAAAYSTPLGVIGAAQPCDHVYEARPIDGSRSAVALVEAVCRKCGARGGVSLTPDMQRDEKRGAESGRDHDTARVTKGADHA